ncbi:hypothetical protein J7T55_008794 [Diaporthe amygdali]|uniref:uncharacterized protein n=1 Tax=Phomopsis amygdali TaxID=1214568 RepID=UPI0022FE9634|nr:uncharacterized protein J7T55_008794 [Diaporthe amygdali]KAJ0121628.1 hypothetical protein J7T55_008794 [Diaporthe amygdali]
MYHWSWPAEILNGPAAVSPDGTYNFDLPPPHNTAGYAFVAVCVTLTTVGALLRAYARVRVTKKVHLEDYLALFAIIPYFTFVWAIIKYIQDGGLFVHQWNIRAGNMLDLAVYLFAITLVDPVYVMPAKAAILWEWKRIFVPRGTRNRFYWMAWFLLLLNTFFYFIVSFLVIFAYKPVEKTWNILLPGHAIVNRKDIDVVGAAFNLVMDLSMFIIPQPVIWSLQMTKSRKIGLSCMFSLGLLSMACAGGRLYATIHTEYPYPEVKDTSYTVSHLLLWFLAEITSINLVMFAPSVPRAFADNTFLGRLLASLRSWTSVLSSKSRTAVSKTWPPTIGNAPSSRVHRLADEDGQAMGLADMRLMKAAQNGYVDTMSTDFSHATTITRTIEVELEEDNRSKISSDPTQQRQHPWMDV